MSVGRWGINVSARGCVRPGVAHRRGIGQELGEAQETRRVLDGLYGYEVSPVLWRKVRAGRSAGRVQSVATRMVVERERERMAFRAASYWDVDAGFATAGQEVFGARLTAVDDARVATGRDFGDDGTLGAQKVIHPEEAAATAIAAGDRPGACAVPSGQDKA